MKITSRNYVFRVVQGGQLIEPVAVFVDRFDSICYCNHFKALGVDFVVLDCKTDKIIYRTNV